MVKRSAKIKQFANTVNSDLVDVYIKNLEVAPTHNVFTKKVFKQKKITDFFKHRLSNRKITDFFKKVVNNRK